MQARQVATVSVTSPDTVITAGESLQLAAVAKDASGAAIPGKTFSWTSSDTMVAVVNASGRVTGRTRGAVSVRASVEGRSGSVDLSIRARRLALDSVSVLTPGRAAAVRGQSLDRIGTFEIDGRTVQLDPGSDTMRTFSVPVLRSCDVDGRPVSIRATAGDETGSISAPLSLQDTLSMAVGESRLLDSSSLPECLKLAASGSEFVVTAVNPSYDTLAASTPLVRVDVLGTTPPASGALVPQWVRSSLVGPSASRDAHMRAVRAAFSRMPATPYSDDPVPFDPKYGTAQVGDTVQFVDWRPALERFGWPRVCSVDRAQLPTYPVRVVAIEGNIVAGVDLGLANAPEFISGEALPYVQKAIRLAAPHMLAAVRRPLDPDFEFPKGGKGRIWMVVNSWDLPSGATATDLFTYWPQSSCPNASEMITVPFSRDVHRIQNNPALTATSLVHEVGHNAEAIAAMGMHADPRYWEGWLTEPWAIGVQDYVIRLGSDQMIQAKHDRIGSDDPVSYHDFERTLWGYQPEISPFIRFAYVKGSGIYMYARQLAGEDTLTADPNGPTLYQRSTSTTGPFDPKSVMERLAAAVGLAPVELLDQAYLAFATDDLVDPAAAAARALPQFRAWDARAIPWPGVYPRMAAPGTDPRVPSRASGGIHRLSAAAGSYAALYLFAQQDRGVSLQMGEGHPDALIRITRIR